MITHKGTQTIQTDLYYENLPLTMLKQCLRIGQAMKELHVT